MPESYGIDVRSQLLVVGSEVGTDSRSGIKDTIELSGRKGGRGVVGHRRINTDREDAFGVIEPFRINCGYHCVSTPGEVITLHPKQRLSHKLRSSSGSRNLRVLDI